MIYLHKLLPWLLSPLGLVLMLLVLAGVLRRRWLAVGATALLLVCASPWFANGVARWVEGPYVWRSPQQAPSVDAVVVLSGMLTTHLQDQMPHWEWGDADRFWAGVALMRADRAPTLVFTGGRLPWSATTETEGQVLRGFAERTGVAADRVMVSAEAANTAQEAGAVRRALPQAKRVLLVTSAFHMPRAQRLFEAQGFEVEAWPVDYRQKHDAFTPMDLLPQAEDLKRTSMMWRELLGRWYYRLKS